MIIQERMKQIEDLVEDKSKWRLREEYFYNHRKELYLTIIDFNKALANILIKKFFLLQNILKNVTIGFTFESIDRDNKII